MTEGNKLNTYFTYQATPFEWHAWVKKCIISKTETKPNAADAFRAGIVEAAKNGAQFAVNFATMVPTMNEYVCDKFDQMKAFDPASWEPKCPGEWQNIIKEEENKDYAG